ncbi:hypothetical protein [Butyrivibrio sp. XPD2002]|uniref:hypothetical protein n=1 Tax=Butyrivibrio sp. XPD2002 TaxID=1280665 RepID=UPI000429A26F|nr:hypothetical protein [Butyrivibrio sp. XPD2002]
MATIIKEKQNLTYLQWSHVRSSSGTAGTFLKATSTLDGEKKYYKLSNFDSVKSVIGYECVNEIIVDRLLDIFGVEHLPYELINADIEIEDSIFNTYLCASTDFKKAGESKIALDDYYRTNCEPGESHYDFCVRQGWKNYIDTMIAIDFIILNRDRHGANIEIIRNSRAHTLRIAPLFDHGVSLLYSCYTQDDLESFDILADKSCNNFIGSFSCLDNLSLLDPKHKPLRHKLHASDKDIIFGDLHDIISETRIDKTWNMIFERYKIYENL